VAEELNVKEIKFTDDVREFTTYTFKPQLKTVGPKYGKLLGGIKEALNNVDGNLAMDELKKEGLLNLDIKGEEVALSEEDLLIDTARMPGYISEDDQGITVVLNTHLTEELLEEGFVRELVSKIQNMRKDAGFEVMDIITVSYKGSEKARKIFSENKESIAGEVMAKEVVEKEPTGHVKEWIINEEAVTMGVEKQ
jgi:isoleucyl-tRNA synthetase